MLEGLFWGAVGSLIVNGIYVLICFIKSRVNTFSHRREKLYKAFRKQHKKIEQLKVDYCKEAKYEEDYIANELNCAIESLNKTLNILYDLDELL